MRELMNNGVLLTAGGIILGLVLIMILLVSTWKKIPNDHAAVIVGLGKPKVVTGGGVLVIPFLQRMDLISLEVLQLNIEVVGVKTELGVAVNAEGVVIIKVRSDEENILTAMQQFYCNDEARTKQKIQESAQELCKGKLREIVSSMTVEKLYSDRTEFSSKVNEVAADALSKLGLEMIDFTVNDIKDNDEYIASLGKRQIAEVKTQAAIAEAEATREKEIKMAEATKERDIQTSIANREGKQAQLDAETQIAASEKEKSLKILGFEREKQTQKAIADAAYDIQRNITAKEVTNTEMDAQIVREQRNREVKEAEIQVLIAAEQKGIELAQKQAQRKEAELLSTVVKPAEADRLKQEIEAEAHKVSQVKKAEADNETKKLDSEAEADQIRKQGLAEAEITLKKGQAEAEAIKLKGLAEAEALEKKAEALAKMDEAGKLQIVMDALPKIAESVALPLSKIDKITIIGGGNSGNNGVADVAGFAVGAMKTVIDAMKETTGFDLMDVMKAQTYDAQVNKNVNMQGLPDSININGQIASDKEELKHTATDMAEAHKRAIDSSRQQTEVRQESKGQRGNGKDN